MKAAIDCMNFSRAWGFYFSGTKYETVVVLGRLMFLTL